MAQLEDDGAAVAAAEAEAEAEAEVEAEAAPEVGTEGAEPFSTDDNLNKDAPVETEEGEEEEKRALSGGEDSWAEWGSAAEATADAAEAAEAAPSTAATEEGELGIELPPPLPLQEEPSPPPEEQQQQQRDPATDLPDLLDDPVAHRRSDPGSGGEDEFGEFV